MDLCITNSGRGGRNHDRPKLCVCCSTLQGRQRKNMQTACSEEVCLRQLLVKSVLESTEDLDANLGK